MQQSIQSASQVSARPLGSAHRSAALNWSGPRQKDWNSGDCWPGEAARPKPWEIRQEPHIHIKDIVWDIQKFRWVTRSVQAWEVLCQSLEVCHLLPYWACHIRCHPKNGLASASRDDTQRSQRGICKRNRNSNWQAALLSNGAVLNDSWDGRKS